MPRSLPEPEEFSEVDRANLAAEEELTSLQSSCGHLIGVVLILQQRWYRLCAIADLCHVPESFRLHLLAYLCTKDALSGDRLSCHPLEGLRLALLRIGAVLT